MQFFILKQNIGNLKKGQRFDSFGGHVNAIMTTVNGQDVCLEFTNGKYFKSVTFIQ